MRASVLDQVQYTQLTMVRIEKKNRPDMFQAILDGNKTFELRLADFEVKPGDILVLKEWDPKTEEYTGRVLEKKVNFTLKTKDMEQLHPKEEIEKHGLIVIAIK